MKVVEVVATGLLVVWLSDTSLFSGVRRVVR